MSRLGGFIGRHRLKYECGWFELSACVGGRGDSLCINCFLAQVKRDVK